MSCEVRHAANAEVVRTLHHQHAERPGARDLQRDRTVELQTLRDQRGGRCRVTEDIRNRFGIVMAVLHSLPRAVELHQGTANRQRLERERNNGIFARHTVI